MKLSVETSQTTANKNTYYKDPTITVFLQNSGHTTTIRGTKWEIHMHMETRHYKNSFSHSQSYKKDKDHKGNNFISTSLFQA